MAGLHHLGASSPKKMKRTVGGGLKEAKISFMIPISCKYSINSSAKKSLVSFSISTMLGLLWYFLQIAQNLGHSTKMFLTYVHVTSTAHW